MHMSHNNDTVKMQFFFFFCLNLGKKSNCGKSYNKYIYRCHNVNVNYCLISDKKIIQIDSVASHEGFGIKPQTDSFRECD